MDLKSPLITLFVSKKMKMKVFLISERIITNVIACLKKYTATNLLCNKHTIGVINSNSIVCSCLDSVCVTCCLNICVQEKSYIIYFFF